MAARKKNQREAIVKKAYALFLEHGYENVKLKDIAAACDMKPSLLQYYFAKRDDIVVAIFYDMIARCSSFVGTQLKELPESADDDADFVSLDAFYHIFYRILHQDNDRLLKLYTVVLYNALSLKGGTDLLWDNAGDFAIPSRTYKSRIGAYAINGMLSQFVALYLSNPLDNDLDALVSLALGEYYNLLEVQGERLQKVLAISQKIQSSAEAEAYVESERAD